MEEAMYDTGSAEHARLVSCFESTPDGMDASFSVRIALSVFSRLFGTKSVFTYSIGSSLGDEERGRCRVRRGGQARCEKRQYRKRSTSHLRSEMQIDTHMWREEWMSSHDLGVCSTRSDRMPPRLGETPLGAIVDGERTLGSEASTSTDHHIRTVR